VGGFTTRDSIGLWGDELNLGNGRTGLANSPWVFVDPYGLDSFIDQSPLDYVQGALDTVGLVPGIGELADGGSGLISLFRGDFWGAGLSLAAMWPFGGQAAGLAKQARRGLDIASDARGGRRAAGAAGEVAECVPTTRSPGRAIEGGGGPKRGKRRGGRAPNEKGALGERLVRDKYEIGEKGPIVVNGRNRIPDGMKDGVLSEVKNVAELRPSPQLRDYAQYARDNGLRMDLYIRRETVIPPRMQEFIKKSGVVNIEYIPGQ